MNRPIILLHTSLQAYTTQVTILSASFPCLTKNKIYTSLLNKRERESKKGKKRRRYFSLPLPRSQETCKLYAFLFLETCMHSQEGEEKWRKEKSEKRGIILDYFASLMIGLTIEKEKKWWAKFNK